MGGFIFRGTTHILFSWGDRLQEEKKGKKMEVFKGGLAALIKRRGEKEFHIALVRGKRNHVHQPLVGFCRRRTDLT